MRGDAKNIRDSISIAGHTRSREEQEIREKMGRGVIGAEIFQEKIGSWKFAGPREGDQENSQYLSVINN